MSDNDTRTQDVTDQTALITDATDVTEEDENLLSEWTESNARSAGIVLTARELKMFAQAVTHFSAKPNTATLERNFSTEAEADAFRAKIVYYAETHNLTPGLPKFVDAHMSKEVVDKETGKITKPAKLIPANGKPKHWNNGVNVTFRFAKPKDKSTSNGPVITTTVDAVAAAQAAK